MERFYVRPQERDLRLNTQTETNTTRLHNICGLSRAQLERGDYPPGADQDMVAQLVEYAPGSCNVLHSHSEAQIGYVLSGPMYVGHADDDWDTADVIETGSVFHVPADEEYFVGASKDTSLFFLVIRPRGAYFYAKGDNPRIQARELEDSTEKA